MKRIKMIGLCLVAVFAMSAVVAGSASAAAPEYMVCGKAVKVGKTFTGKFTDKTCKAAGEVGTGGKYELAPWTAAKKLGYKGKNGVSTLTVFAKGFGIVGETQCQKAKTVGEVTGPKTSTTVVTFEKCVSSGKTCTSAGAKKGAIVTFTLNGLLVAIEGGSGVGIQIKGGGPGGKSAEFICEGLEISTTGAVTGEVTGDIKIAEKTASNIFTVNGGGEPTLPASEPLLTTITGAGTFESGEDTTAVNKGEAFYITS